MKVKCVSITNPHTGAAQESDPWLTRGRIYVVLAVLATPERGVLFRLVADEGRTPALFDSRQFEATSARIPSNWVAVTNQHGELELAPAEWARAGFWDDYFNQVPDALKEFEEARAIILSED